MAESRFDSIPPKYAILPTTLYQSSSASDIPLVLKSFLGQTANMMEMRSSTNAVIFRVGADGNLYTTANGGQALGAIVSPQTLTSTAVGQIPLTLTGASGQTADLQQWKNNAGTLTTSIKLDGTLGGSARDDMDALFWMGIS